MNLEKHICSQCGRENKNNVCIPCEITESNKQESEYYRKHEEEK